MPMLTEKDDQANRTTTQKPLGLCLSGGGAIGFAHIGAIQALTENGIIPDMVAGSSMGAIVGTFYAAGFTPKEMLQMIKEDRLYMVSKIMTFKPGFWRSGFSSHHKVHALVQEVIPHDSFEKLSKRLFICVTNLNTMEWEIKGEGSDLADWVTASASIPGVFEVLTKNGAYYSDGGILNNLPAQPLVPLCRAVIGVDVLPFYPPTTMKLPVDTIRCVVRGVQHVNSAKGRSFCQALS